jgi:hypothetical protein
MKIEEKIALVKSRKDLSRFLQKLADDFSHHKDSWENQHVGEYLEAISAWLSDTENSSKFKQELDWTEVAGFFAIGKDYE